MITLRIDGNPAPQGSKSFKGHARNGRAILVESSQNVKPWRATIAAAMRWKMRGQTPHHGPTHINLEFIMPRPKSAPKRSTPPATKRPDIDKLARAVLDAITGIAIADDSQITRLHATKRIAEIGEKPGVIITITEQDTTT